MTTLTEARDYVNGLIYEVCNSSSMETLVGYKPLIYWDGNGYVNAPTNSCNVTVTHDTIRRKSIEVGIHLKQTDRYVLIEVRSPISVVNSSILCEDIIAQIEDFLVYKRSDSGVIIKHGNGIKNRGVEGQFFVYTISIYYFYQGDKNVN